MDANASPKPASLDLSKTQTHAIAKLFALKEEFGVQLKIDASVPISDNALFPIFGMMISVIVRGDIPLTLFHAYLIRYGIWNSKNVYAMEFLNAN